jgi:hypothetical protein
MEVRESDSTIFSKERTHEMKRDEVKENGIEEEYLTFLDELRESGITNMLGAAPFIEEEFGLNHDRSVEILVYWMRTFTQRHEKGDK